MSEQFSATHGPAEDEAIKRQEWPEPGSDAAEAADATWASPGRFAGTPGFADWEAIELRSDLARHLDRTAFPATREHLLETLSGHGADDRLLDLVSSLPGRAQFASLGELIRALGLPVETRPA